MNFIRKQISKQNSEKSKIFRISKTYGVKIFENLIFSELTLNRANDEKSHSSFQSLVKRLKSGKFSKNFEKKKFSFKIFA